jgi:hypothetical protein
MKILFIIKVNILVVIRWLYAPPSIMLTIELRMIITFFVCRLLSLNLVSFGYPFLEPHLTTHHLSIHVQVRNLTEIGNIYIALGFGSKEQSRVICWPRKKEKKRKENNNTRIQIPAWIRARWPCTDHGIPWWSVQCYASFRRWVMVMVGY